MAEVLIATLLRGRFDALVQQAMRVVEEAAASPPPERSLAYDLRTRLAVRGWVNPHQLTDEEMPAAAVAEALNTLADEVETAFDLRPGEWYLSVASRSRILVSRGAAALRAELEVTRCEEDAKDPIRLAFRLALGLDPFPGLAPLDISLLGALANVLEWLGALAELNLDPAEIEGELARRTQARDLDRMTAQPLVGEIHRRRLRELEHWLLTPSTIASECLYLYGSGGAGKSTLLAFLQHALEQAAMPPVVIRLDFDEPLINPADSISLDIALFDRLGQLSPSAFPNLAPILEMLRKLARDQRNEPATPQPRRGLHRKRVKSAPNLESSGLESIRSSARSERNSILYFSLEKPSEVYRNTLVLILDTAELVMTQGEAAIVELTAWLKSLHDLMQARDVRIVIAGRDPPAEPGTGGLIDRLATLMKIREPVGLPDLNVEEAGELLRNCGVSDLQVARAAAEAVPRNPLLLRITADALQSEELVAEVRSAHGKARVDAQSANTYLARRIVSHLADPAGRPYVLAAMHLPSVSRAELRDVLIPVVDESSGPVSPRRADRVFTALRNARWLARPTADSRTLHFHPDLRALGHKLLASDPEQVALAERIHRAARAFHAARRGGRDRAYALYHTARLGEPVPYIANPAKVAAELREVLADLPRAWRDALLGEGPTGAKMRSVPDQVTATAIPPDTDEDWRLHLEGVGTKPGEGDRLLERDRANEALALYRQRPTRPWGAPPTFVIRALADTGDWDTDEVDLETLLEESKDWLAEKRMSPAAISRLYWITRFALFRDDAHLSEWHAEVLERCCARLSGSGLSTMPALIAVAEASLHRPIMGSLLRRSRGAIESATRVHLVQARFGPGPLKLNPTLEAVFVAQRDWDRRLLSTGLAQNASLVLQAGDQIRKLDGLPISQINSAVRQLQSRLPILWDGGVDLELGILVLRGHTTEFLRPLRQAVADLPGEPVEWVSRRVIERMSIRPAELAPDRMFQEFERDRETYCATLVGFSDRARLLPLLCDDLARLPGPAPEIAKARRVAQSFLAWDKAICDGLSSGWPREGESN